MNGRARPVVQPSIGHKPDKRKVRAVCMTGNRDTGFTRELVLLTRYTTDQ